MNMKTNIYVTRSNYSRRFWTTATDALPLQDATALAEDLVIEFDTDEHVTDG
jgi:26S proteasome regulatory subunit, ATPase 3, interacting protein